MLFTTVKEAHIAVENGLQHITANRKQSIQPEYIDMALNLSVLQYIDTALTPEKNAIGKGFEHNQVVYDELSPLRNRASLTVYNDGKSYYCILPSNYRNHISSKALVKYKRSMTGGVVDFSNYLERSTPTVVYTIPFPDAQPSDDYNATYYNNCNINVGYEGYTSKITTRSISGKFMVVNDVLREFYNNDKVEIYWQEYDTVLVPNSFIVVDKTRMDERLIWMRCDNNVTNAIKHTEVDRSVVDVKYNTIASTEIIKSVTSSYISTNYYYQSNAHKHLYMSVYRNRLVLSDGANYIPTSIQMEYHKIPRVIDYKTNIMSDLKINNKIISMAIQHLMAVIKDEGYQYILQENKTI